MFMRFRGGGIGHKILRDVEHMLTEKDEWEDIEEELDIVMQDVTEAAGPIEGDDANTNNGTDVMVHEGEVDQNENEHEEENGDEEEEGDGDGNDDNSDGDGDGDSDDVDMGAEDGEIPDYIGEEADYDDL